MLKLLTFAVLGAAVFLAIPSSVEARACPKIVNPYADTRYEGVDLRRIRAWGTRCHTARQVVRGAHEKALGLPPRAIRRFYWHGWKVVGDIRDPEDHYRASMNGVVIRWIF